MAEWWSAQVVTRTGKLVGELPRIRGGSLDWNAFSAVQAGGSLDFVDAPDLDIDWTVHRIRILHHTTRDGARPIGVYVPAFPARRKNQARTAATVKLESPTCRLRSQLGEWVQYEAGERALGRVRQVLRTLGETQIALDESAETLRSTLTYEPDKTWGAVLSETLDAINYSPLWVDVNGWWRAARYIPPPTRPVTATYGGQPGDHPCLAEYEEEADLTDVPNRVYLWTRGDNDTPGLRAVARILDKNHPWHPGRVGLFTRAESVEATSQDVLNAKAARILAEGLEVSRYLTWTHPVDGTQLGDRVRIRSYDTDVIITHRRITLGLGACVESKGRHIYTGGQLWE